MNKLAKFLLLLISFSLLPACGGGEDLFEEYNSDYDSGGSAPAAVLGYTIVQTVSSSGVISGDGEVIQPGETITYTFIDADTILGDGLTVRPTTSWSYSGTGSSGVVTLNYTTGTSVDTYTFTSSNGGVYRSEMTLITGSEAWHEGAFVISASNVDYDDGSDSEDVVSDGTGQVVFWTTVADGGSISIYVDGYYKGSLTQYFSSSSSSPSCGDNGGLTLTLAEGYHSFSAEDESGRTWDSGLSVTAAGCLAQLLY